MSLATPVKVEKLQQALHAKAKASPQFRFYQPYDKVYREDVLSHAYRLCHANGGAPGVDGETFGQIVERGEQAWLEVVTKTLREKTCRVDPVRRVWIPKANGKLRPLGTAASARCAGVRSVNLPIAYEPLARFIP